MSDPPELGRLIARCAHLGRMNCDQILRRAGYDVTPPQTHMLEYLCFGLRCSGEGEASQRDLERELRLKPSTINGIVSRLEEKGYVKRRPSPDDARVRLVSLTETGRGMVGRFRAAMRESDRRLCAPLSDEECRLLEELLAHIITNLENEVNHT